MKKNIKEEVKKKYGETVLKNSGCGCSTTCCDDVSEMTFLVDDYNKLEGYQAIADYGLGCGLPTEFAEIKEADTVIDLGSGAGNDVFIAAKLCGNTGKVIGVDFTPEMIQKAYENKQKLGISNVDFLEGDIENLPVSDAKADVIISNCVLNLVPNKHKAFSEIYRVLKPGGHFSISDIVSKGVLPESISEVAELYAGCISGAVDIDSYLEIIKKAGFENLHIHKEHEILIPENILLKHISPNEVQAFRKSDSKLLSITLNGYKAK